VVGGIQPVVIYYWRVRAKGIGGTGAYSAVRSFTTQVGAPSIVFPANNSSGHPTSITFQWRKVQTAIRYWLQVASDSAFASLFRNDTTITDSSRFVAGLTVNARYYWRVAARDPAGWGPFSPRSTFQTTVTDVAVEAELPRTFALAQNYPNPFNPSTRIEFDVPRESHVRLDVYNLLGERIATLVDETRSAGIHSVQFDASALPSGLYLYRMSAGELTFVRKMILTR
jgi:hypothetical protein